MNVLKQNILTIFALLLLVAMVGACSSSSSDEYSSTPGMSDPLEEVNRAVFGFNREFDHLLVYPIVDGYRFVVPSPARKGVHNVLSHLQNPVYLANHVLQGNLEGATRTAFRSVVNSFVGFGGLLDVAGYEGYTEMPEDFGQTLAVWGVDHGPYVVVPFLGPSSARDYAGYFVDSFMDPLRWYLFNIDEEHLFFTKMGVQYLDLRNELKDTLQSLEAGSVDYYASVRSTYYQVRENQAGVSSGGSSDYYDEY